VRRSWILILIAGNLLVLLGLAFAYPHLMVSPGPLVPAHSELTTNCFACHAPFRGAAAERCTTCHALPDIGLRTTKGLLISQKAGRVSFHQALIQQDCMACHSDHPLATLTPRSHPRFSHALLRAEVRGRCETCHSPPNNEVHRDLSAGCAQCHSSDAWKPATFDHAKLFVLDRDHNVPCVTCHLNNNYKSYTCYGCHEHQRDKIRTKHIEEGIRNLENCVTCHRSASGEHGGKGSGDGEKDD
jgi:hypothetical protein